jgi:hypothetical protein
VRLFAWGFFVVFAATASAADVYRSVDANGNIVYSDRPEGANPQLVSVFVPEPATPPPAASARPAAASEPGPGAPPAEQVRPEPTPEQRQQNCVVARERAERYAISHRLYRSLPNGEREYLNDAEIDEARARAAADVGTWCS